MTACIGNDNHVCVRIPVDRLMKFFSADHFLAVGKIYENKISVRPCACELGNSVLVLFIFVHMIFYFPHISNLDGPFRFNICRCSVFFSFLCVSVLRWLSINKILCQSEKCRSNKLRGYSIYIFHIMTACMICASA